MRFFQGSGGRWGGMVAAGILASGAWMDVCPPSGFSSIITSGTASAQSAPASLPDKVCSFDAAVPESSGKLKGKRRLALIVGVGKYKNDPRPKSLVGPPNDADRMYTLLTDPAGGFGFPTANVCLLKNEEATLAAFEETWQKALVNRAQDGDVVVFHYSGHGSQARDGNLDEPDGKDETLMLSDARFGDIPDLVDDKFNLLLGDLFKKMSGGGAVKEQKVTVILDSCNSGSATRDPENEAESRFFETSKAPLDVRSGVPAAGTGGAAWDGAELPGLVFLSGAVDGTAAKEIRGEGIFTAALIQVLKESAGIPMTYDQLGMRLSPLVAARSDQRVQVQGGTWTSREVFGDSSPQAPAAYKVKAVDVKNGTVTLRGTPLPGWGSGAQVRVYAWPPTAKGPTQSIADLQDPKKAKATLSITAMNGVEGAVASVLEKDEARVKAIQEGDMVVLAFASKDAASITVRLAPEGKTGGIPATRARAITDALAADADVVQSVKFLKAGEKASEAWLLSQNSAGKLQLFDPTGTLRVTYAYPKPEEEPAKLVKNLGQHARQKALLQMKGEAGGDFINNHTLKVQVVPLAKGRNPDCDKSADLFDTSKATAGAPEVDIPLGVCWQVKVKLADDAPMTSLFVGGLFLTADGGIEGFPSPAKKEQQFIALEPGKTLEYTFKMVKRGAPPIKARDHLLIFGTREEVKWSDLTEAAALRGDKKGLQGMLAAYTSAASRGAEDVEVSEPNTWTSSHVALTNIANAAFKDAPGGALPDKREYTVQNYDIREMLPSNSNSALYKLLTMTHQMSTRIGGDGSKYKQAPDGRWDTLSDVENLDLGIDCSRALWFAYTRAGLAFNNKNNVNKAVPKEVNALGRYVTSWEMVDKDSEHLDNIGKQGAVAASPMRDQFTSCQADPDLRPGDILVYRRTKDAGKVDGHVVMVIDPDKAIAWGSHAWDGTAAKDTGVEYQRILKAKTGLKDKWGAWDKSNMIRVDCWRHNQIAREWEEGPLNQPGTFDLSVPLSSLQPPPPK